ncbi:ABC-F family ATP-binding cassette domain-containing protein [Maricaulis sp.]|uniref:ABC-F family ATP-binding cassette domain-containing protein n=1 Tax=Maricaulis sp. TaxID=1486257 RepID=UPI001B092CFD|nr:ABC-F family ATP-binding cassette domain-containing protein [Maricaulis sp.]MBO6764339.1 ABC-F family ATP-binding cassette domain-containing protein [Maricaulis sp.]
MLHINDLTYRIEGRMLFDQATLFLPAKAKMGLVGRNGTGKSTLFRLIRGEAVAESGDVRVQKGVRVGSVAQEAPGGEETLMDVVLAADSERAALLAEAETATDPDRIAEIQTRLADIESHTAEARAGSILSGLGFTGEEQQRPCREFSGGWRMRVALAATLFARPDLLLLDEPTNYLDLEGVMWLQSYLKTFPGAALVISHDRDLLNGAMQKIAHLKQGKLSVYEGGYDDFEKALAEKQRLQMKLVEKQEAERRHLQSFVDRFKAKASKAKQAQSRVKRLEKMQVVATQVEDPVAPFDFPNPQRRMAPPIVRMLDVSVGYEPGKPVLRDISLNIDTEDRIGILGRNGAGKSTLAKLLNDRLEPLSGHLRKHKKLEIAFFAQHQIDDLSPDMSAYQHVIELMEDATEAQRRARLARFGLPGDRQETPAKNLSGGEKARLLFNLITFGGPHLLILDEPTNHLDMDSRAELINAINAYEGAVVLITHDRHIIESCVDRLWVVGDGTVTPYDDDIETYRQSLLGRVARDARGKKPAPADEKSQRRRDKASLRETLKPLKAAAARWEKEAERLRGVIEIIDKGLAAPGLYEKDPKTATELQIKRAKAVDLLDTAELNWLEAAEALETAQAE